MRLKYVFETMDLEDQIIAVPVGENVEDYHGVIKLNETAARIFECLKEDVSFDSIVKTMAQEYEVDRQVLMHDVQTYLNEFQEKGLLIQ